MADESNFSRAPATNCSIAESIVSNPHFQIAVTIESACGVYAFVSNIFLLAVGWRAAVFSPDLRLLLGHLSFILAWYGFGGLVKGAYLLGTPVCDLEVTFRHCRILEVMTTNITMVGMFFSLSAVCVERFYATVRYRRYDRAVGRNIPYLAICSIVFIWAAALSFNLYGFAFISSAAYTPVCDSSVFASRSTLAPFFIFCLSLEVLAVFATIFIYFYNRHMLRSMVINRALYDLSSRFQVDQNVQVNEVMMPSMILHLLCFLPNYALLLLFIDFNLETKAILLHVSYLWRQVYAGVHPTLAFALNSHLKHQLRRSVIGRCMAAVGLPLERGPKTTDVSSRSKHECDAHFKHLEDLWSGRKPIPFAPRFRVIRYIGDTVETNL